MKSFKALIFLAIAFITTQTTATAIPQPGNLYLFAPQLVAQAKSFARFSLGARVAVSTLYIG
jgi:hypothetical protein